MIHALRISEITINIRGAFSLALVEPRAYRLRPLEVVSLANRLASSFVTIQPVAEK